MFIWTKQNITYANKQAPPDEKKKEPNKSLHKAISSPPPLPHSPANLAWQPQVLPLLISPHHVRIHR